jgi:hypothetical protein
LKIRQEDFLMDSNQGFVIDVEEAEYRYKRDSALWVSDDATQAPAAIQAISNVDLLGARLGYG